MQVNGYWNPQNADSAKIYGILLHPSSGDIIFWHTTNATVHLVRMSSTGKVIYNITGVNGVRFDYVDYMTYIEDDDTIWTNIHREGGLVKVIEPRARARAAQLASFLSSPPPPSPPTQLRASDGSVVASFTDNVLDSMGLPFAMVYDKRSKLVHFGRVGNNVAFALNALTGEPVWQIPVTDAGWPSSAVLCPTSQRVVFFR